MEGVKTGETTVGDAVVVCGSSNGRGVNDDSDTAEAERGRSLETRAKEV